MNRGKQPYQDGLFIAIAVSAVVLTAIALIIGVAFLAVPLDQTAWVERKSMQDSGG